MTFRWHVIIIKNIRIEKKIDDGAISSPKRHVITPQNNMYFAFPREVFYDLAHLLYPVIYHK